MHRLKNQTGSVLTIVLVFATCTFITVSTYFLSQYRFGKKALQRPRQLQSLLTARSGVILGLELLNKNRAYANQSEIIIDSLDDPFGFGLFDEADEDVVEDTTLEIGGGAITLSPFVDSIYGICTLQVEAAGNYLKMSSGGEYRKTSAQVEATLGSLPFISPDTVLYLEIAGYPEGPGRVSGQIATIAVAVDSGKTGSNALQVSQKDLKQCMNEYQSKISMIDSGLQQTPLTITDSEQFAELPAQIEGSLMLDGQLRELHWESESTYVILGDLQTTGDVVIDGLELVVEGEVKIFDRTILKNVTIFTQNKLFLANQAKFQGQITAQGDIEIYDDAVVESPSCIVAAGEPQKKEEAAEGTDGKYTLHVRNRARVDGVLISTNADGGILTESETILSGILWAEGRVCHQGQLRGIIKAKCLVSEENPFLADKNVLEGAIEPLERVSHYYFPFYVGELSITAWKEGRP